jgi:hypothetical protein
MILTLVILALSVLAVFAAVGIRLARAVARYLDGLEGFTAALMGCTQLPGASARAGWPGVRAGGPRRTGPIRTDPPSGRTNGRPASAS